MKITKQYIIECDCPEIQDFRKDSLFLYGDYIMTNNEKGDQIIQDTIIYTSAAIDTKGYLWLPREDQIDDEIVKICKGKNYNYGTEYYCDKIDNEESYWWYIYISDSEFRVYSVHNRIRIITKIRILKELLKNGQ